MGARSKADRCAGLPCALTPGRLVETVQLVREAEVPAPVWAELKAAGLIPKEFPTH